VSKQTSITWDIEYRVDRYKVGQRVEVVPVIETINGKPVSDFPPEIVRDVTETLWNDDGEFNDEVERRRKA
jgi:hypothetical protein